MKGVKYEWVAALDSKPARSAPDGQAREDNRGDHLTVPFTPTVAGKSSRKRMTRL